MKFCYIYTFCKAKYLPYLDVHFFLINVKNLLKYLKKLYLKYILSVSNSSLILLLTALYTIFIVKCQIVKS